MKHAGFTLLEMLVGLTLMAFLAVMLSDSLRTGLDVTDRVETRSEDTRSMVIAHRTFHKLIESAFPLRSADAHAANLRFTGNRQSMELVGPSPATHLGGLTTRGLLIRDREIILTGTRGAHRRVGPISHDASFHYFGIPERGQPPQWLREWKNQPGFPLLVRLRASGWPDAVSRPRLREAIR
jgi:prepilin-type N-terminal cleavage/methylation domain-containing protein